jgi:hypothetical protein
MSNLPRFVLKPQPGIQPEPTGWPPELNKVFHELWTRDVGTPGYDKSKWKKLDNMISELLRRQRPQT